MVSFIYDDTPYIKLHTFQHMYVTKAGVRHPLIKERLHQCRILSGTNVLYVRVMLHVNVRVVTVTF